LSITKAQEKPVESNTSLDTSKFVMKKSAWGAVLRSAVLPGFGQFYNRSYWKIPVVWGAIGYLGYQWKTNNDSYKQNKDLCNQYNDLYEQSETSTDKSIYLKYREFYRSRREFYRDQRDLFAVFIGLSYFLNLVDAYVDAQLFDFSVEENQFGPNVQMSVKIKF
jgi:hypothetical protein